MALSDEERLDRLEEQVAELKRMAEEVVRLARERGVIDADD